MIGLAVLAALLGGRPESASADTTRISLRPSQNGAPDHLLKATIRYTRYGVPHIRAHDIESVAAGYAYAYARDNICTIANEYVTVAGQRSRFFGPDASWTFSGNGSTYKNAEADFYFKWISDSGLVRRMMRMPPPLGPKRGVRAGVKGYVAGYNAYLKKVGGPDGIKDPTCRGADWVKPIKQIDAYRRFFQLGILASSGAVIDGIVNAAPVSGAAAAAAQRRQQAVLDDGSALSRLQPQIGSNAYGIGANASRNGRGIVLGNPHFPWDGSERLYQAHLQIPGKLNVSGGSLNGVPLVLIGNTRGLAWSHTVATAWRFTPFALTLAPGDPYSYIVDGEVKPMQADDVTIKALNPDGTLGTLQNTIYSTEYGPVFDSLVGIPLPWNSSTAFALADVNATNFRYLNHFYDTDHAQTVRQYDAIERRYQGVPWVNSIAADSKGNAYYSMQGAIPYVTDEHAADCNAAGPALDPIFQILGLPILDGSRSECNWESSPDAVAPGTFPPDDVPTLITRDYVTNGNDSHWLSNPDHPLEGFDRIIGIERAERTYRTRIGVIQVQQRIAGTDGLPGTKFNRLLLQKVALGDRQYAGEMWRDALVGLCDSAPGGFLPGSNGPVDVSGACDPLAYWDLHDNLDSGGAILFRRFASNLLGNFTAIPTGLQGSTRPGDSVIYTTPFSAADPVNTPRGLNVANPLVRQALADAVTDLEGAGIPLDAGLRGYQYEVRGGKKIPIHGGPGTLGVFNAINVRWDPENDGYGDVPHGSSFIMAAQFNGPKAACPVKAGTFVTYGQTENQLSKHASDYTRAFSRKDWNEVPFCRAQLRHATLSKRRLVVDPRPGRRSNR